MDIKIQLIVAVIIVIAMGIVVMMIKNKQLELRYALSWFALGVGILILDCFPDLITELANMMGIGTPINMLFSWILFLFNGDICIDRCGVKTHSESKKTDTGNRNVLKKK